MATTLEREAAEQRRWHLRPAWAQFKWHELLLRREFLPADQEQSLQSRALSQVFRFAAAQVPYYRDLFHRLSLAPERFVSPADLPALPLLTRAVLREQAMALRAAQLPEGEKIGGPTRTSGSTGQPVEVLHSQRSLTMFPLLKQRHLRWARFDPAGRIAMIRPPKDLPRNRQGRPLAEGESCHRDSWAVQVGPYFETGDVVGFSNLNSLDSQLDWLDRQQPDYLLGQSAEIEHLVLGFRGARPPVELKGVLAISQQMMPDMRESIERCFSAPVHENYGFNEIGIVATRCPESGRYHVNSEHCLVEIVDEEGKPCAPGERGRLLVTSLTNLAMPLLRYDSGDIAETVEGPCPCGRRLPTFGSIHGRYRRLTLLPPDAYRRYTILRRAVSDLPDALVAPLRQFQIHQFRDDRWELRVVAARPLSPEFHARVEAGWRQSGEPVPPLRIVVVDAIPLPPSGKFQDFSSDFVPEPGQDGFVAPSEGGAS